MWFCSANHDDDGFGHPWRFDLARDPNDHMAFGRNGPHLCLGAWLARMEARLVFEELMKRVERLEPDGEPQYLRSNFIAGIKHLPVRVVAMMRPNYREVWAMGSIVGAALVSHVPPLVMPEHERRALNGGEDTTLFAGLHALRAERLAAAAPDTVVVVDTHWFTTVEHVVTAHARRKGLFTSDELPRGMCAMPYDMPGDPELARAFEAAAVDRDDTWVTATDDPHPAGALPHCEPARVPAGRRALGVDGRLPDGRALRLPAGRPAAGRSRIRSRPAGWWSWPAAGSATGSGRLRQFRDHEGADPDLHIRTPGGGHGRPSRCCRGWRPATMPPSSTSCPSSPAMPPRATSATT